MLKSVLFCVTGSIASIKAPFIIRELKKQGFNVTCILSLSAKKFITPFTLSLLSENDCYEEDDFWSKQNLHIQLAKSHDILLIAPATANTLAKCANGIADNLLLNCFLAFEGKKVIVPAMHTEMIQNKIVKDAIQSCKNNGCIILGPTHGKLLSDDSGYGRMVEPLEIATCLSVLDFNELDLTKQKIVITTGGTTEKIDPVRTLSNQSSGKIGEALARIAYLNGAAITLISTQTVDDIGYQKILKITNSNELLAGLNDAVHATNTLIMAAAVSDYIPIYSKTKLRRNNKTQIPVTKNQDILQHISAAETIKTRIGFCLHDDTSDAKLVLEKLQSKHCDYMIANDTSNIGRSKRSYQIYNKQECLETVVDVSIHEAAYRILKTTLT